MKRQKEFFYQRTWSLVRTTILLTTILTSLPMLASRNKCATCHQTVTEISRLVLITQAETNEF